MSNRDTTSVTITNRKLAEVMTLANGADTPMASGGDMPKASGGDMPEASEGRHAGGK